MRERVKRERGSSHDNGGGVYMLKVKAGSPYQGRTKKPIPSDLGLSTWVDRVPGEHERTFPLHARTNMCSVRTA